MQEKLENIFNDLSSALRVFLSHSKVFATHCAKLDREKNAFRKLQHSFIPNKIKAVAKIRLNIQTKLQGWQHKTLK